MTQSSADNRELLAATYTHAASPPSLRLWVGEACGLHTVSLREPVSTELVKKKGWGSGGGDGGGGGMLGG